MLPLVLPANANKPRPENAALLYGWDLFISFALGPPPRGSRSYASDLARRLRERGFTVFFSEEEASPGATLDDTLRRALHRSRCLVVIANRGTLTEPRWVRAEVEEFRRRHPQRPVIPISIDGALQDPRIGPAASAWLRFDGRIWIDETASHFEQSLASDAVIERLVAGPRLVRPVCAGAARWAAPPSCWWGWSSQRRGTAALFGGRAGRARAARR